MGFTAAELAAMARADAEIEAAFRITNDEIALGRELDREAILERMDSKRRRLAEAQRRYREANKEKVSEGKRAMRSLRKNLGLSQKAFAQLLGVTQPTVCYWETVKEPANWRQIVECHYLGAAVRGGESNGGHTQS